MIRICVMVLLFLDTCVWCGIAYKTDHWFAILMAFINFLAYLATMLHSETQHA